MTKAQDQAESLTNTLFHDTQLAQNMYLQVENKCQELLVYKCIPHKESLRFKKKEGSAQFVCAAAIKAGKCT